MTLENNVLEDYCLMLDFEGSGDRDEKWKKRRYDFSSFLSHASHIKTYDFIAEFCRKKKVLDIGCNTGYGEIRIDSFAKEITAIDMDERALEFAKVKRAVKNTKFQKVNATKLPFSDNYFDVVITSQVIEHIKLSEIKVFLSEAKRVLKNGGIFFVITPNRKFRLWWFQKPVNPEHFQEFTAKNLSDTLKTVFSEPEIKGIRAKKWIEEIEYKRCKHSLLSTLIIYPAYRMFPRGLKEYIRKARTDVKDFIDSRQKSEQFKDLVEKFSMDDFFLSDKEVDRAIALFAICRK